jgi:hypothetical protein
VLSNFSLILAPFVYPSEEIGSQFNDDRLGFLVETILATEEDWEQLPGLAPLLLREVLAELLEVAS